MTIVVALAAWAMIVLLAAFKGALLGFSGQRFALALGVAATLFAFEFFLAAPAVLERASAWLGGRGAALAPLVPLFAVLTYSLGLTHDWRLMLLGAAYAVVPALLVSASAGKAPGAWGDYAAAIVIWLPLQFHWMYRVFPYPQPLTHTLAILMALSTGVAAFVMLRRLEGAGYAIDWGRGYSFNFSFHFIVFALIAIPLGMRIGFLKFGPQMARVHSLPFDSLAILFFTAWPEEFFFRGLLQNLLSRTLKNQWAGLIATSVIFGFSHIVHAPYPNWKYVLMATIAGFFYGRAWMKTGSLVPGTLVHALVDLTWHVLFR
jgi:hypothetical protein